MLNEENTENLENIQNISDENLNEEINSNSVYDKPRCRLFLIAFVLFWIIYFSFGFFQDENSTNKKRNKIIVKPTDRINEEDKTDNQDTDSDFNQKPNIELVYNKEDLVINKTYPSNRLFIFSSEQITEMKIEGEKINKSNSYHNFSKTTD